MFDQSPKQSIDMGGGDSPLEKVDNTPTLMSEALPKPKPTLPKPPNALSSFPPEKKYGDVEDIFADVDKKEPVKEVKVESVKSEGGSGNPKTPVGVYVTFAGLALVILVGGAWLVVSVLMSGSGSAPTVEEVAGDMPGEVVGDVVEDVVVVKEPIIEEVVTEVEVVEQDEDDGPRLGENGESGIGGVIGSDVIIEEEVVVEPVVMKDTDSDGLTDGEEAQVGTNPILVDSDSDQLTDYEEVHVYFTNPLEIDTDEDGLSDFSEVSVYFSDPNNIDTDGDTYSDGVEVENGYSPVGGGKLEAL